MALITPKNLSASNITTGTLGTSYYQQPQNDPVDFRLGKVVREYAASTVTLTTTSLVDMFTGSNTSGFTGGSHLELHWYIPSRKDASSGTDSNWNGMYFQPCLSFDNGTTWYSLGTCGYDGGTMTRYASMIHNYINHAFH